MGAKLRTHCLNGHTMNDAYVRIHIVNGKEYKLRNCRTCTVNREKQNWNKRKQLRYIAWLREYSPEVLA